MKIKLPTPVSLHPSTISVPIQRAANSSRASIFHHTEFCWSNKNNTSIQHQQPASSRRRLPGSTRYWLLVWAKGSSWFSFLWCGGGGSCLSRTLTAAERERANHDEMPENKPARITTTEFIALNQSQSNEATVYQQSIVVCVCTRMHGWVRPAWLHGSCSGLQSPPLEGWLLCSFLGAFSKNS